MRYPTITAALALCASAGSTLAQLNVTVTRLYRDGDVLLTPVGDTIGAITAFNGIDVNNAGTDLVEIDTDHFDTNADIVVMRDGVLFARENDPAVAALTISSFDSVNINSSGNVLWNNFFRPTGAGDSGIRFNSTLVQQEGAPSTSLEFTVGTPYIGYFEVRGDDNNDFMVMASVDDPVIASTVDRAIVLFDYNTVTNTYSENVLWKEGDTLPGMTVPVPDFNTGPETMSYSPNGQNTMFSTTGTTQDGIYINSTLIAQENGASPIAGRNFGATISSPPVSVNDSGAYAFRATLAAPTTSDSVIFKGTQIVAQEGSAVPGIPGFLFTSFGTGPVLIDSNGGVLWAGDWDDPDTTRDIGLFYDQQLILREGDVVDGETIVTIRSISEGYNMSPDGRFVIVKVVLTGSVDAVLLLELSSGCDDIDFNNDGLFPDTLDIDDFISVFQGGTCSNDPNCGDIDFNNDGLFPDTLDIDALLSVFSGGPCLQ